MKRLDKIKQLLKQAQERQMLQSLAEQAPDTNDASEQEAWAHKALKLMLEQTTIDLPNE